MLPTLHPKVLARWVALASVILMGTRKDLLKLTCNPVLSEKGLNKHLRLNKILASPGRIRRVSSAYCRIGKSPPKLSLKGCYRVPFCHALFIIVCSRSPSNINRRGERRTPA
jgi:hypothetical protein